ncbi:DUF1361 domain-containing protein [Candidatus Saccharibacteria bacterium]|nr:DUF1361 domain-containing protein [Candidatus Saccharibacteria bacterium]MCB9821162.1 DUF1361 domain-containing protein [Candidatus Nomurabacteria bacterium]
MKTKQHKIALVLALVAAACVALSIVRYIYSGTIRHLYLPWNLLLGSLPLYLAYILSQYRGRWFWVLFIVWLLFLPNAFYIVTDLLHLNPIEANLEHYWVGNYRYALEPNSPGILFDTALLFMYSSYGFLLGLISTGVVHDQLLDKKRFKPNAAWLTILGSLFLSGLAIFIGRRLRLNSWDIATDPVGLVKLIANIFLHPIANAEAWAVTLLFFYVSACFYLLYRSLIYLTKP